ncbi:MAG TPA: magnesium transporter [Candidatus Limnocylindrales bacterium]|jgi:magnesium transporter
MNQTPQTQERDQLLSELHQLIAGREREGILGLARRMGPTEWAELIPQLDRDEVATLVDWLPDEQIADLLAELEPEQAADILRTLAHGEAADVLEEMPPDDAADVVAELAEHEAAPILIQMRPDEAAELRDLLAYPADTAGGMMTPAYVAVRADARASDVVTALRRASESAETFSYIYVVDDERRLVGVLSLRSLVLTGPGTAVRELMAPETIRVRADVDREAAARLVTDYNFLALPVVDAQDRLLGIITQDDVADVLEQEATEDIERLGGQQPLETSYRLASVPLLFRRRIGWLLLLFVAGAYTGTVMRAFEQELQSVIALSLFIPLLIGTGGNIGSQTVTLVVRAMGIGEVRLRDLGWVLWKELRVGLAMGAVLALVAFGRAELPIIGLAVGTDVALIVAISIFAIALWAITVAAVLPLLLRRLGVDPAVVSAPLITTLVDGTGLIIYFEIARLVLRA